MKTPFDPRTAAAPLLALLLAAAGCPTSDGSCESSAICEAGTFCFGGRCVAQLPAGSCTPPTSGTITTGAVSRVAPSPSACLLSTPSTWPTMAAPFASGWETPLGQFTVGETVTFTVPPGATSVTIHSQAVSTAATFNYYGTPIPNSVVPTAVKMPNGGTLFADDITGQLVRSPVLAPAYYGGYTPIAGSFTVPATSRLLDFALSGGSLPAGDWSLQVNDWNVECAGVLGCSPSPIQGVYDLTAISRPGPFVSTGTLDVAIYLVGGAMSAAAAAADPAHLRFVAGIGEVLGRAGICLGTVTFFEFSSSSVRTAFSTLDICDSPPCGELAQLFSLASPSVDGVHLFLVDVLSATACGGSGGGTIVGIDGSIPGPSGLPGAVTSGAAMSEADINLQLMNDSGSVVGSCGAGFDIHCKADFSAYIAAHEIGHWLGLYHTTEATGDQFDPLADTRTCSCESCGFWGCGGSSGMAPADCSEPSGACGGGDNLMFWVLDLPWSQGQLSAEQGLVMRVNPAVK